MVICLEEIINKVRFLWCAQNEKVTVRQYSRMFVNLIHFKLTSPKIKSRVEVSFLLTVIPFSFPKSEKYLFKNDIW